MSEYLPFGVTWYGVCVSLAAFAAFALLLLRRRQGLARRVDACKLAVWCIPCALLGARLMYCLFRFSFFFREMGPLSVLNMRMGGFLLYGAVFGAMGAAALAARHDGVSVVDTLDELAAPGMLAVLICRLAEGTTTEGVGAWVENEALMFFPLCVQNEYGEWQLALFLLEALIAAVILVILLRGRFARGEQIMTALLLYACFQVICESMRADSCLRIGFVRVSQVISAVVILAVTVIRSLRYAGRKETALRAAVFCACAAAVGGMEWALDKTQVDNRLIDLAMLAVCAALACNGSRYKGRKRG